MRRIYAKKVLRMIAYDVNILLDNEVSSKTIYDSVIKRLSQLKDNNYQKIDWS
jgi:hypothetical protein